MADRHTLHKSKLKGFEEFLHSIGYETVQTKGDYEVLRAQKGKEKVIVYSKLEPKEHYTVMDKDFRLLIKFLKKGKSV